MIQFIYEMSGRNVVWTWKPLDEAVCADCGKPAPWEITEIGETKNPLQPQVWRYCGICEVG